MGTENRVVLELLQSHSSLVSANPVLKLGQKVYVTGIATDYYPYKIGDGVSAYNSLKFDDNPRRFGGSRIDSQELTSGTLTVSGWYTIAEISSITGNSGDADFKIFTSNQVVEIKTGIRCQAAVKNHANTLIEILSKVTTTVDGSLSQISGFRLAKSDTVIDSGAKLQVFTPLTNQAPVIQMSNNIGLNAGWELVTPYLDNTPTLPDGVTVGTFLEAGEELSFDTSDNRTVSGWIGEIINKDVLRCEVQWPEIPKQGIGLTLTLPAVALVFRNDIDTLATISTTSTTGLQIVGRRVMFNITQTDIGLGAIFYRPVWPRISGSDCKLTII